MCSSPGPGHNGRTDPGVMSPWKNRTHLTWPGSPKSAAAEIYDKHSKFHCMLKHCRYTYMRKLTHLNLYIEIKLKKDDSIF